MKLSISSRVKNPQARCLTTAEASFYLLAYTIMGLATATFLWEPGEGKLLQYTPQEYQAYTRMCDEPYSLAQNGTVSQAPNCTHFVNVYDRFTKILQAYFFYFAV